MPVSPVVVVLTTLPAGADTGRFARTLVEEGLAACVSVSGEMDSHYAWQGAIEHDRERQVVIKTVASAVEALRARFPALHPYDVPEFLVLSPADGEDAYLAWVRRSVRA